MSYYNYQKNLRVYRRRLPHWEIEGGVYFVTARLKDSVPVKAAERIRAAYGDEIKKLEGRAASSAEFEQVFEWFHLDQLDGVLDFGFGECLLARGEVARVLWDAIQHFDGERYDLIAVVVMPNHFHVVFRVREGFKFSTIVGAWKSYTYTQVRKSYGLHLTWQDECFDRLVRDPDELRRLCAYVLDNPSRSGLIDWPWVEQFVAI